MRAVGVAARAAISKAVSVDFVGDKLTTIRVLEP